jgi:4-amino-4-deoxy-L-arabinose transferase-like glycosyltransferase
MEKIALKLKGWIKAHPRETIILLVILAVGAFLRLYRIDEYMIFLADQGRDALVVRRLLVYADPILVGPGTSVGNMYLGPIYYYLMAPALWLANYSPVGPSVMVALFGIATIFFVWYFARKLFGEWGAFLAALLYAISPTVVSLSIFSWNPNIMPFFALLTIYSIWQFWAEKKYGFLMVAGGAMGFVLQSHYLGLILLGPLGIFWLLTFLKARQTADLGAFFRSSLYGLALFILLMSPLFIFDARHQWRNLLAMREYFLVSSGGSFSLADTLNRAVSIVKNISFYLLGGRNTLFGNIVLVGILLFLGKMIWFWKKTEVSQRKAFILILVWLGMGILGLSFYKNILYDHYYGFLFPTPFLLLAGFSQMAVARGRNWGKILIIILALLVIPLFLSVSHQRKEPNRLMRRTIRVADKIMVESKGTRFNLAAIAQRNYEGAYQYFLEKQNAPLVIIDPQNVDETITGQLFVICEEPEAECDPTHSPKAEIANYGWSKIEDKWEVEGITLYKLVHSL